jgi:hypothetical protein
MKEFKGTKGKWSIQNKNGVYYIVNEDCVLVAELDTHKTLGFIQPTPQAIYSNSELIAAAPDLLKLAKFVYEVCNTLTMPGESEIAALKISAKQAIEKALSNA